MKKIKSLIIGTGAIGAYLSKLLIEKKHNIVVTSRFRKKNYDKVISEAILLNKSLIKLPNQTQDIEIKLTSNILDVYNQTLLGHPAILKKGNFKYYIDRTSETWDSWEDWCEKVVWWSNKKGAYLYDWVLVKDKKKIKTTINNIIDVNGEPFGSDARYQ